VKINKSYLKTLARPDKETWIKDDAIANLWLRVWPSGKAVWVLRYRTAAGTMRKLVIGDSGTMDPDEAHDRARKATVAIRDGTDPQKDRAVIRRAEDIEGLGKEWLAHQRVHVRDSTYTGYDLAFRIHLNPKFGKVRLHELTSEEVERWHRQYKEGGRYAANSAVHTLSQALTWAQERRGWITKNPLKDFQYFTAQKRQHVLTATQIKDLIAAMDSHTPRRWAGPYLVKMLLFTGLRLREWALADWSQYDDAMGTLTLPEARTKTGARTVQLGDEARIILRQIKSHPQAHKVWIFPNSMKNSDGPMAFPHSYWTALRDRAGLPRLRIHDLRHTFASYALKAGANIKEVQQMLGHSSIKSTDRYVGVFDDQIQQAQSRTAQALMKVALTGQFPWGLPAKDETASVQPFAVA